ncbi:MAG: hypothetical protein ACJAWV_001686 [Flammeovirgaceae bacterium]|jgi:hypothetical protein
MKFPKTISSSLFLCFLASFSLQAQFKNVKIHEGAGGIGPCEPSISINPANSKEMVAGAVLNTVAHSKDGGKTWDARKLKSSLGVWGDPCILADSKGNFHYFHLSDPTGRNWKSKEILDRMVCQSSSDGGKTWSDGASIGLNFDKDQDKEWGVVDLKTNHIYLTWTQFDKYGSKNFIEDKSNILFSKSTDGGKSWNNPVQINQFSGDCIDDDLTTEGAVPAVGSNGELYVTWSLNGKLYFDKSLDGGATWMAKDKVIAEQPEGWAIEIPGIGRANGFPVTVCDVSEGENKGAIYVNWSDQRNGKDNTDVWIMKSTDQGETWSEPKKVNDDKGKSHQFFNWLAVDPVTGSVYVVFYDRRAYEKGSTETDVYIAYSKDGGDNFTNLKISEKSFTPNPDLFFGDYNNISVYNGIIRPIWTRVDGAKMSVWTALVEIE